MKYDTKGHCNKGSRTIAGQNDHALSDITETSALNITDQSALNNYNIFIHAYKYISCKMCTVLNMVHIYIYNKYI